MDGLGAWMDISEILTSNNGGVWKDIIAYTMKSDN